MLQQLRVCQRTGFEEYRKSPLLQEPFNFNFLENMTNVLETKKVLGVEGEATRNVKLFGYSVFAQSSF